MKERRTSGRSGDETEISEHERELRRRLLEVERLRRLGIGRAARDGRELAKLATSLPCKLTRVELELARAEELLQPLMNPASALAYASWMMARERGWSAEQYKGTGPSLSKEKVQTPGVSFARLEASLTPAFDRLDVALTRELETAAARSGASDSAAESTPRERLAAAAERGEAAELLAKGDPAELLPALHEARQAQAPVLRLVARQAGDELEQLVRRGSSGAALSAEQAARFSPHLGEGGDDAVRAARLHTGEHAELMAEAHAAHAVTRGDRIYFGRGELAPGTEAGDDLLAHELTHVAQGQRGELARAAAKGLTGGTNLDASEAEAELRAKLAVIELHAPAAQPAQVAAPSGQPSSDGERQARIAQQQKRIADAQEDTIPDEDSKPVAASSPGGAVTHPGPEMKAPAGGGKKDNAYVAALDAPPSKQAMGLWDETAGKATTQAAADQSAFDAGLPPMPIELSGDDAKGAKGGGGKHQPRGKQAAPGAVPPAAQAQPTPPAPPVTAAAQAVANLQANPDPAAMEAEGKKAIAALPTTSPDVKTDPGTPPVTDLAGQADPVRVNADQQTAYADGAKALDAEKQKILSGPGAAQIQPIKLKEKLDVPKAQGPGQMPELPKVEGMDKFKKWNLPGNVQSSFDEVAKPKMEGSLAQAKSKMTEAEVKRDTDRDKAVNDAQDKVKKAHADADVKQQAKVADSRTKIANKQADTLGKQEAEVKKLDKQSGEKKKGTLAKVNDRIAKDQAQVETDYQGAQKKADEEKQKGEKDAEKKKEEAKKKAEEDKSWWDKACDVVCDAIDAIAEEIDKALEAVGKLIGDILDAVKNAACALIDAARDFVCAALEEFGDWLKSAVTALIGSVFPELAAALNKFIDDAVNAAKDAVNAIADGLKKAVTELCDGLKNAVNAALAAFRAAVQAAAALAKALVTGDWAAVAKMVLEGILRLLGIDPAAFYALVGKAEDSIAKIIDDPGAFVGHLVDAVKLGFQQFGANFLTHLKDGVVQWLFGTFAEAGINIPAQFNVAGVFDLTCQVLGLTWPRMRVKVVKVIGEENTERLEFVAQYIEALVSGGFAGLWEKVQQDMAGLWEMVIGGAKQWLMEKLVQQAIIKIATMWNPAGAIIQLIQTAWNVYCWVKENAQRIFGLVQAVVDSISNIANGNIAGAANYIESSLAKLVPIAISLFANLLGLGGIADKIKEIITKIQTKVDQAIDKLIERVLKMFKGKGKGKDDKDGDGKADGKGDGKDDPNKKKEDENKVVGIRVSFQVKGETHTQYLDKGVPMVASTPTGVKAKIEEWRPRLRELPDADQKKAGKLIGKAIGIEKKVAALATEAKSDKSKEPTLEAKQRELADTLAQLWEVMAPEMDPDKTFAEQDPKATLKSPQYAQFKSRFLKLAADLDMPGGDAKAQEIWLEVVTTLQKTDAAYKAAPTAGTSGRKDLAADGFKKIMSDFDPITNALKPYMEKYAKGKKTWAFWSGKPSVELAKKHAEVCLEKSALGSLFDNINISGGWDIQMWASLSKAYATHAASHVGQAKYSGFVGMGSSAEQSIFNKIEQPQFVGMLSEKQQVDLKIDWYAAAGDPKTDMRSPDYRFEAGIDGVYAKGERGAMVEKAETENKRRLELWKEHGIDEGPEGNAGGAGGFDPIVTKGSMEGTPHSLTVKPSGEIILASEPAPAETKVKAAIQNLAGKPGTTEEQAKAALDGIKAQIEAIKAKLTTIPPGTRDGRVLGPRESATKTENLSPLAKDLMALSAAVMQAINQYGSKFKVHEIDEEIANRFPTPDVGLHTVKASAKNASIVAPDGLPRESHHVPNAELFQTLLDELDATGQKTSSNSPEESLGFNKKGGFLALGKEMSKSAGALRDEHPGGNNLSAILVHRITHQNVASKVGTAAHSAGMAQLIDGMISAEEKALTVEYQRIMNKSGLAVKPMNKQWKPYVDKVRQQVAEALTPEEKEQARKDLELVKATEHELTITSERERDAMERIANGQIGPVLRKAFDSAFAQTFNAITAAVGLSQVDGDKSEKNAALGRLRGLAESSWRPLIQIKFRIPDTELELANADAPIAERQAPPRTQVGERVEFQAGSEAHAQYITVNNGVATPMVSSDPMTVEQCLAHMSGKLDGLADAQLKAEARQLLKAAHNALAGTKASATAALKPDGAASDGKVKGDQRSLGDLLRRLFEIFPEHDTKVAEPSGASMASNPNFEADAKAFEAKLAPYAWGHSASTGVMAEMTAKAKKYLIDKAGGGWDKASPILQDAFNKVSMDAGSGFVGKDVAKVMAVFDEGNVSERFVMLVRFYTEVLGRDLALANQEEVLQRAEEAGMKAELLAKYQRDLRRRGLNPGDVKTHDVAPVPETSDVKQQGDARERRNKLEDNADETSQRTLAQTGMELSERELAHQQQQDPSWDVAQDTLRWMEGARVWCINERNAWVQLQRKLSLPLGGGPSGTTNTMMSAGAALNADPYALRLAAIGYVIGFGHHTLVEIMVAAAAHGCSYTPGQKIYRDIQPLSEGVLRGFGKGGKFPDESSGDGTAGASGVSAPKGTT